MVNRNVQLGGKISRSLLYAKPHIGMRPCPALYPYFFHRTGQSEDATHHCVVEIKILSYNYKSVRLVASIHSSLARHSAHAQRSTGSLTMMRTRLASFLRVSSSPKAFTSVVRFFFASGRDMARMTGLRGFWRNLKIVCMQKTEVGLMDLFQRCIQQWRNEGRNEGRHPVCVWVEAQDQKPLETGFLWLWDKKIWERSSTKAVSSFISLQILAVDSPIIEQTLQSDDACIRLSLGEQDLIFQRTAQASLLERVSGSAIILRSVVLTTRLARDNCDGSLESSVKNRFGVYDVCPPARWLGHCYLADLVWMSCPVWSAAGPSFPRLVDCRSLHLKLLHVRIQSATTPPRM